MTRDTRTPHQARQDGHTVALQHAWMQASRQGASQDRLERMAQGIAATKSTGAIRAGIALVASIVALHWAGGIIV